jgi:hypothetical protein
MLSTELKTPKVNNEKKIKKMKIKKSKKQHPNVLHSKQELLLCSLIDFFSDENNKKIIVPIVKQETAISLRLLDWLITNYSKKFNVFYEIGTVKTEDGYIPSSKNFNLWLDYKNQLKAYSKKIFDPFSRRQRIFFDTELNKVFLIKSEEYESYNEKSNGILTTIGQLNFFKWAIVNKVIDYAFSHLEEIESDMLSSADKRDSFKKTIVADLSGKTPKKIHRKSSKNINSASSQKLKIMVEFK